MYFGGLVVCLIKTLEARLREALSGLSVAALPRQEIKPEGCEVPSNTNHSVILCCVRGALCNPPPWLRSSFSPATPVATGAAASVCALHGKIKLQRSWRLGDYGDTHIDRNTGFSTSPSNPQCCLAAEPVEQSQDSHPHQHCLPPQKDRDLVHLTREVQQSFK